MLGEEVPHHSGGVDVIGGVPGDPFRQVFATRPDVASTLDGIENDVRIVSAICVSKTADAGSDSSFDRISLAVVSLRHMRLPLQNIRK